MSTKVNDLVTSRVVTRWFFNGKGYASRRSAYRAKAKRLLIEMVLGPWVEECSPDGEESWAVLKNAHPSDIETDRRKWLDERFALFFPHDWVEGCVQRGCQHYGGAQGCRTNRYGCGPDAEWEFAFESCKWSQEQWINAKVRELIAQDEADK